MKNRSTGRLDGLFNVVIPECFYRGSQPLKNTTRFPITTFGKDARRRYVGGFTLIELLVVVLIIGILATVALPQYQRAVERSRVATMQPLLRAIASAKASYFMANGSYPRTFEGLDISLPSSCGAPWDDDWYGQTSRCGNYSIYLDSSSAHTVAGNMRLSDGSHIYFYYSPKDSGSTCTSCPGGDNRALALCLAMGYPAARQDNGNGCLTSSLP